MGLRELIASIMLATAPVAQACERVPLWPDVSYELFGDAARIDPDLERRIGVESDKLPGQYRALLADETRGGTLIVAYVPPTQLDEFSDLDPNVRMRSGVRIGDTSAFVLADGSHGYYNPERVASLIASEEWEFSSVNVFSHEIGHLVYHALDMSNSPLLEEFVSVSEPFRIELERGFERGDPRGFEAYVRKELFAEAFARMYANERTRDVLADDYPELFGFMDRLERGAYVMMRENVEYETACPEPRIPQEVRNALGV